MNKKMMKCCVTLSLCLGFSLPMAAQVAMHYQKMVQGKDGYQSRFVLKNTSGQPLKNDWTIYFSQLPQAVQNVGTTAVKIWPVNANFFAMAPTEAWTDLQPGDSLVFDASFGFKMYKTSQQPEGWFFVGSDGKPAAVPCTYAPFADSEYQRGVEYKWQRFSGVTDKALSPTDVLPAVKQARMLSGTCMLDKGFRLEADEAVAQEGRLLKEKLEEEARLSYNDKGVRIVLSVDNQLKGMDTAGTITYDGLPSPADEYYELTVGKKTITIKGCTPHAVWDGAMTLLALLRNPVNRASLACMEIKDQPDFAFRSMMLDVGRNFTPQKELKKMVDVLAEYKLDYLHLHLVDDEGWRLEIPGIPELTEVGSRRGYTTDERDCLYPGYDGNFDPEATTVGNGFISRAEYIELIKYAQARHVQIIPEIECPGHSRAAVKSMEARYYKYKDSDPQKAMEYLLTDFADSSDYEAGSAQGYRDNVMNIALPSTQRFLKHVLKEVAAMHREAGVPLPVIHLGGDEVAPGSWKKSPACHAKMRELGFTTTEELSSWFYSNLIKMMDDSLGVKFAGWQEMFSNHPHLNTAYNRSRAFGVNCWNAVAEWNAADLLFNLANQGVPMIVSNVSNTYCDLAYSANPDEPGLIWGGYVDEATPFNLLPYDPYRSQHDNVAGTATYSWKTTPEGAVSLTAEGRRNIIGVQGQLWAETIRGPQWMEYQLFPKALGVLERGWNAHPFWEAVQGEEAGKAYAEALNLWYAKIDKMELPALASRVNIHVTAPGLRYAGGAVEAAMPMTQGKIHYTVDGSEPTAVSPVYNGPVKMSKGTFKARFITNGGQQSAVSAWVVK